MAARGVTFELEGEGTTMSQGPVGRPQSSSSRRKNSGIVPEESIIVGNTVMYGADRGRMLFPRHIAGERFACVTPARSRSSKAPAITAANT